MQKDTLLPRACIDAIIALAMRSRMKIIIMRALLLVGLILVLSFSCRKSPKSPATCEFSNAGNDFFTIVDNNDSPERAFNVFCKKVDVFGLKVYAVAGVTDAELLHCANVLAQYLDNDEDGVIDNQLVLDKMLDNKACMTLFSKERSAEQRRFFNSLHGDEYVTQDLYGTETFPGWNLTSPFDATLEEVLHLVTFSGYSRVYPSVFGEMQGSEIANAMDLARGGQFTDIPSAYPAGAWYSYDDKTCEYNCQVTEYFYWALTSLLGAQDYPGRLDEIGHEWKANTPVLVQSMDPAVYALLTDTTYQLPTQLPDGSYQR